jgi:hypothetical protein
MKKYDFIGNFIDGFAIVEIDNKYGFINEKFEEFNINKIYGIKATNRDMTCLDFKYKLNKKYEIDEIEMCQTGFHFCLS